MDFVQNVSSFVLGFMEAENELRDSLDKLDVLLTKCDKMFKLAIFDEVSDRKELERYRKLLDRNRKIYQTYADEMKEIGITKKIAVNLPFNMTRKNINQAISELTEMHNDLKERIEPMGMQTMKRKVTIEEENKMIESVPVVDSFDPTIQAPEEEEMGPTIEDKQEDLKGTWVKVRLDFECEASRNLEKVKKDMQEIAVVEENFKFKDKEIQRSIMNFNRSVFKPHYPAFKGIFPEVDFISSKEKHFDIICRRMKVDKQVEKILFSVVKECSSQKKHHEGSQQKHEQKGRESQQHDNTADVFFSFPININAIEEQLNQEEYEYELVCKNYSKNGTFHSRNNGKWERIVEGEEVKLQSGDRISPVMKRPERTVSVFHYLVQFETIKYCE